MKMNRSLNLKIKEKNENEQIDYKTIQNIIQKEFIDSCEKILIENQSKFIEEYFTKIILIIKNIYGDDIFQKSKSLNKIIYQNKMDFIKNIYNPMFKLCSLAIKQYSTNNIKENKNFSFSYLNNFRPHCMNPEKNNNLDKNYALHICGGKFILIIDYLNDNNINNNINVNNNSYIICTKCKKCYFPDSIPMICCFCYTFYYSEIISENVKNKNCYLATWSKYHCKNINNEKMSCIKCGEDFYLRNNKLFCKKCKFEIEPNNIIWTCLICNSDFNSNAKIYNPLEFKEAQLILKNALLYKKIVKPIELPCKCITNETQIEQMNFYHKIKNNINKKECKGLLYFYEINNKKFIVCSLCLNIYTINKFKWSCPICFRPFTSLNIKLFHLKEKNSNNNSNIYKNIMINKNIKNQSFKNTSKKKTNTISILDTDNSYSSNNTKKINKNNSNNNNDNKCISTNKTNLVNNNIRNVNSYIKKQPKDIHRMSSYYSSSSKDLLLKNNNNRINNIIISNNRSITNNNSTNKTNINKIRKNNTINNGCLYSLNIKKRRNLSEIPNEMKNDIYFLVTKNNKHENKYNSGTGSTIFSSLSNQNLNSPKETLIKANNLELTLNNNKINMKTVDNNPTCNKKLINNSNNYNLHKNKKSNEKKIFYYKNNKRNILINNNNYYYQNSKNINNENIIKTKNNSIEINNINTINNECKGNKNINNTLLSLKNIKKLEQFSSLENIDYNNTSEDILYKKLNKKQKGNKSFYIKEKKFILLSPENEVKINKDINNNEKNKRNTNFNNKNIFKLNEPQLELKQKIPFNNLNNSKNFKKNRNNINKKSEENDYFNYFSNNNDNNRCNNKNNNNLNNLTIINNSNGNTKYNINYNNSINSEFNLKKKKNISFEKMNKCKIKNGNQRKESPKSNNYINYNFSNELKNALLNKCQGNILSKNSKGNISNTHPNNSIFNDGNKLKQFNFDDYTIITQLGQGSFGKIYLVKDSKGNIYSMKKILLSEELDVKNVISEYNMCYNLSHPNIIKIIGVYSNRLDKTTFVVYVLMEVGISDWDKEINSYKIKKISYTEDELISILKQLVSSLSFLQKNNISHRDIKPQNILIFKNKIYKLTDFGEARQIGERDKNNKSVVQYSLKGTELYMSPLLFNGLRTGQIDIKHNTYKSDVYSLGLCLLYAATTFDKALFEIRRIIEMDKIRNYVKLSLKDKYSDKLINIIVSMLEIHEQKRPDFLELEKIMENY